MSALGEYLDWLLETAPLPPQRIADLEAHRGSAVRLDELQHARALREARAPQRPRITWRDVFDTSKRHWESIGAAQKKAKETGYLLLCWNGDVYPVEAPYRSDRLVVCTTDDLDSDAVVELRKRIADLIKDGEHPPNAAERYAGLVHELRRMLDERWPR